MVLIDDIQNGKKGEQFNAGSKARADIDSILNQEKLYFLDNSQNKNLISRSISFFSAFIKIKKNNPNSIFIIQYPLYVINIFSDLLYKYLKDKKTIVLIHDLNSLRKYPNQKNKHIQEVSILNQFDVIISHNKKMSNWLKENGLNTKLIELDLFDYLAEKHEVNKINYDVSFAGNLSYEKSKFLYDAINNNPDVSFELFGIGYNEDYVQSNKVLYKGAKKPEEIINCFHSKLGLIWDGDSIETCSGNFGNYERYNNPHKLSMYIAAQIPVIVWKEAAIADFVKKHNVGIVVDSLIDLSKTLNKISLEQYQIMVENTKELSQKVRKGHFTKQAYQKAIAMIKATT